DQVEITAEMDVQELAVPGGTGDHQAGGGRYGRVVGLEGADRGDLDPRHGVAGRTLAQVRGERLHLGQLGHADKLTSLSMKVVVAHNRYSSAQPSGENVIVDAEIAQLGAAGVEVVPFLRSSDEIASLSASRKALLPLAPIWAPDAQRELVAIIRE